MKAIHQKIQKSRWGVKALAIGIGVFLMMENPVVAQSFSSGSNGSDGAFNPAANITLALPPDGVFHFTSINIPQGVTVLFTPNATNTPVTFLATEEVIIDGVIGIGGSNGTSGTLGGAGGQGGPGGFRGGSGHNIPGVEGGAGIGPGGGVDNSTSWGGGGAYGTQGQGPSGETYGSPEILPLIGGSGGAGSDRGALTGHGGGGGGGGGAMLIASSRSITVGSTGRISANGGKGSAGSGAPAGGGGSGGAIRLVANILTVDGVVEARGGAQISTPPGGNGRIRLEGVIIDVNRTPVPSPITGLPSIVSLPNQPSLSIISVGGVQTPASPTGGGGGLDITLPPQSGDATIELAGSGIPLGTSIDVTIKPERGLPVTAASTPLAGTTSNSSATATAALPEGGSIISASVTIAAGGGLASLDSPIMIGGEPVEKIKIAANFGEGSSLTYITKSGKEHRVR